MTVGARRGIMCALRASLVMVLALAACGDGAKGPIDAPVGAAVDAPPDPDPLQGAWSGDFTLPGLAGSPASATVSIVAPDGRIVIGGTFSDVAGVPARNIAAWDGTDWAPLGGGIEGNVDSIAFDAAGTLWATATPPNTGSSQVWRYDASAWTLLGTANGGIVGIVPVAYGGVVIAGRFSKIDGVDFAGFARFTGAGWLAVPTFGPTSITALAASPAGFCIAGSFSSQPLDNAACYDAGTLTWSTLGAGLLGSPRVLALGPDGAWYAGGSFSGGIARLAPGDVSWQTLDSGIGDPIGGGASVRAIGFRGGDVIVGGVFTRVGPAASAVATNDLARWSVATGWTAFGGGVAAEAAQGESGVSAIAVDASGVFVAGVFARVGTQIAIDVARISPDGAAHAVVGPRPTLGVGGDGDARTAGDLPATASRDSVNALAYTADGKLIAAGSFHRAGAQPTSSVASLAGGAWTDLQSPSADAAIGGIIYTSLVRADGTLVVAGDLRLGDVQYAVLQHLPTGWAPLGPRVQGVGRALLETGGALWLGGLFPVEQPGDSLMRFDGAAWTQVGVFDDTVLALALYEGELVVGGAFTHIDGQRVAALARRRNGAWEVIEGQVGQGVTTTVEAIAVSPTLGLVIGGTFTIVDGVQARSIAYYDGAQWRELGGGLNNGANEAVIALAPYRQGIFAAGSFRSAGNTVPQIPTVRIAWFDGAAWHPLAEGVDLQARALQIVGRTLYVGGTFHVAGTRGSSGIAAWTF